MVQQSFFTLLVVAALAACSSEGGNVSKCSRDEDCAADSPGDTEDDGDPKGKEDAAAHASGASDAGAARSRVDAAARGGSSDAGQAVKDAAAPVLPADSGAPTQPSGNAKPSAGCGAAAPMAGNATIDVMGTAREYILTLPKGYDPAKPYKLVFAWHGLGGTAAQIARGFYGLMAQSNDGTIFVAGQGLETSNSVGSGPGWPNTGGQDVAFVKALYARLQTQLCIDEERVFSVGMSYGGIMSNTLGCQMGDVFRAIAPMSGSGPGYGGRGASCVGDVAVWMSHGDNDTTVPTASGEASRDYWAMANHCQTQTTPVDPSPCVAYSGCDPGRPVTWCEFAGGHTVPPFASKAIWTFFSQF
jgi:polyhydroxybutyrate depolymerase